MRGLTAKQLKFAQWYLFNKKKLKLFLLIFVIVLNVIIWGTFGYQTYKYFSLGESHEKMLQNFTFNAINYLQLHKHFQPKDLIIEKPIALNLSLNKYDFAVNIQNPNKKWLVEKIEYYFLWDNGQTETRESFILPGQEKYILALGIETNKRLSKAEFVLSKVDWRRINPNDELSQIPSQLIVKDIELDYAISEKKMVALPRISFLIKNKSVYNFWEIDFLIILYQGSNIVGLNIAPVKNWQGNEQRQLELIWPNIPSHSHIQIIPVLNPFDSNIFIPTY